MRLRFQDKKVILLILGGFVAFSVSVQYWYVVLPLIVILFTFFVLIDRKDTEATLQSPVLRNDKDAERKVLDALRRKVVEYKPLETSGVYVSHIYDDSDGLRGYEDELQLLRRNLRDIGLYKDGSYFACSFPKEKLLSELYFERNRHYTQWFNETCDKLFKKFPKENSENVKRDIVLASDHLLATLGVAVKREYIALKLRESDLRYHIACIKRERLLVASEEKQAQREYEQVIREAEVKEQQLKDEIATCRDGVPIAETYIARQGLLARISELERMLDEVSESKQKALSMAQQTRAGYVYVISNVRSFGEGVYKIGMTRRLDPMDRVHELGDASVPFPFDVHYMIYTDDAPKLEAELHQRFAKCKMNSENYRKEFFRVSLEEIKTALREYKMIE